MADVLAVLKALGDETRLRIAALLGPAELAVSDLTRILQQSQPRVSRHLKILDDAGIIKRHKEGAWVFIRLADDGRVARIVNAVLESLDREIGEMGSDRKALDRVMADRQAAAQAYFAARAEGWDAERSLYIAEEQVEAAIMDIIGTRAAARLLDVGTGTGRMLELFGPGLAYGLGIDINPEMLRMARARLESAGLPHCQVRLMDMYQLPADASYDAVIIHQVLHFAEQPEALVRQAAAALAPGGQLVIADFAQHQNETMRSSYNHLRLGFADGQVTEWLQRSGLLARLDRRLPGGSLTVSIWTGTRPGQGADIILNPARQPQALPLS